MRRIDGLVIVLALLAASGCSDNRLPVIPVNGTITFGGGPPPKPGTITFTPVQVADGMPHRPAMATFDTSGRFQVTSFREHDGLVPGTYHASVDCWKQQPTLANPITFETYNYVPKDFQPPSIEVDPDADEVDVVIEVPNKKMT
jgi:hypothetical protein